MTVSAHHPEETKLATGFTAKQCQEAIEARDRDRIADAIKLRFTERYINPVTTGKKHGFTIMAISCLMLEALESFQRGWTKSSNQSEKLFVEFLDREIGFKDFRGLGSQFYKDVRCGILHQAETTNGWRILRSGPLFDGYRTINAEKFIRALQIVLDGYCERLKNEPWGSKEWNRVHRKMNYLCTNCKA